MVYAGGVWCVLVVVETGDTATVVVDFVWVCASWEEYPIGVDAFLVVVATGDTTTVVVDFVWACVFEV